MTAACGRCKAPTYVAATDGVPVHLHPAPLTPWGEVLALMDGATTYTLGRAYTIWRYPAYIKAHPADTQIVMAEHVCGRVYEYRPVKPPPTTEETDRINEHPPF